MPSPAATVVILGTGGTIAGTAAASTDAVGYRAAQLGVQQLVAAVPALAGQALEAEQVVQVDSKDMTHAVWQRLAQRCAHHLARDEVQGLVVTHGTDTLEETAWFLHRVLAPAKPLVLTAAMRPATSLHADGPQNLLDAVTVARWPGAAGVLAVMAGCVHRAAGLRKLHPYRLDAFGDADGAVVALVEEGRVRQLQPWPGAPTVDRGPASWPTASALAAAVDATPVADWPRVEVVTSHAGADGWMVDAMLAHGGLRALVVAATGNGTVHHDLQAALDRARARGVRVLTTTRCALGARVPPGGEAMLPPLSPWQWRVEVMLDELAASASAALRA